MSSPSPTPPTYSREAYDHLITILGSLQSTVLEIDILPPSYAPVLLHAHSSVGVPKSLLITCFLTARSIFFSFTDCHGIHEPVAETADSKVREEALQATAVILLHDPNHITAINFRKRFLLSLKTDTASECKILQSAVEFEDILLQSFLTSPLSRHAKSSTLWAHRLWLLRTFPCQVSTTRCISRDSTHSEAEGVERRFEMELEMVMRAGERHARNYYAWDYARRLFGFLAEKEGTVWRVDTRANLKMSMSDIGMRMGMVHKWCLAHPRDISGWSFLSFLMLIDKSRIKLGDSEETQVKREQTMRKEILDSTVEFARKFGWSGESLTWFLQGTTDTRLEAMHQ